MNRKLLFPSFSSVTATITFALALLGCEVGGVGDPCIPEDEYTEKFSGFSVEEVNVESRSFQCETRICLVNHFQGRVSCPYGNKLSEQNTRYEETNMPGCYIPNSDRKLVDEPGHPDAVAVNPQLVKRQAKDAVYCSCRCDGPDPNARYCECPSGFACRQLIDDLKLGSAQLVGKYCVREGTEYVPGQTGNENTCRFSTTTSDNRCPHNVPNCNDPTSFGYCGRVDQNGAPED